jgi:hypothetical protein
MSKGFTVESHAGYIHVIYPPDYEITRETMIATCDDLMAICREKSCFRIILEAPSPVRKLNTTDAFESGTRLARISAGLTVAMVFYDYKTDEMTEFFKTVAQNRGVRVQYFTDVERALDWLGVGKSNRAA